MIKMKIQIHSSIKSLILSMMLLNTAIYSQIAEYGKIPRPNSFKDDYTAYITKSHDTLRIGDTLIFGKATGITYMHITQDGRGVSPSFAGRKVVVHNLHAFKQKLWQGLIFVNVKGFGMVPVYINYEIAFETGEILHNDGKLNREQAIAKLKEAKDLLDLQIITQEEYDKLKDELTPIIKEN